MELLWFNRIFLLFVTRKSCVFQIFLLKSIKAYLCSSIINFDSVDFIERRPEDVISFFWRSVYITITNEGLPPPPQKKKKHHELHMTMLSFNLLISRVFHPTADVGVQIIIQWSGKLEYTNLHIIFAIEMMKSVAKI